MAPITTFQKLKLDTKPNQKKPARHQNGSISALLAAADCADAKPAFAAHGGNRRQDSGYLGPEEPPSFAAAAPTAGERDIESQFRNRTTSISFDRQVTLDSGSRLSLNEPLPKPPRPASRLDDSDFADQDPVASLTSETTASPVLEEIKTPLETSPDYLLSPLSATSPLPSTSPIDFFTFSRRNGSQRSRSYRELADAGRTSRRSSTRSGRSMSSMSPAASFLAKYKAGELKPTEPDDEGQAIGFHNEHIIGKQLGFGGFSVVKECTTMKNGKKVTQAVKIVRKQLREKTELENEQIQSQFDHEVEIWRYLHHPYVLPLLAVYNTSFATYCVTRLNEGGTLFDLIRDARREKKNGLPSHLVKRYAYQLASAIRYLHNDVLVVHRDIKLENCLVDMTIPDAKVNGGNLLLCDFGMADFYVSDQRDGPDPHSIGTNQNIGPADTSTSVAGSLQYAAPELFNAAGPVFSPPADIWAFGVVFYSLLTAQLPFNEGFDAKTAMKIRRGEWDLEPVRKAAALQHGELDEAIELVRGCLAMEPESRWAINDILTCSYLDGCMHLYEHVNRSWIAES